MRFTRIVILVLLLVSIFDARSESMNLVYIKQGDDLSRALSKENTTYIIRYTHNLGGKTITIGSNSILDFQGGTVSNGVLDAPVSVTIQAPEQKIFSNVRFKGGICQGESHIEWFVSKYGDSMTDKTDAYDEMMEAFNSGFVNITFNCARTYYITKTLLLTKYVNIISRIPGRSTEYRTGIDNEWWIHSDKARTLIEIAWTGINGDIDARGFTIDGIHLWTTASIGASLKNVTTKYTPALLIYTEKQYLSGVRINAVIRNFEKVLTDSKTPKENDIRSGVGICLYAKNNFIDFVDIYGHLSGFYYVYDFLVNEKTWATNYKSYASATAVRWTTERTGARSLWFYGDFQSETDATNTEGAVITASTTDVHLMGRIWDNQRPYLAFAKKATTDEHITKHILSYGTPLLADSYQPHILRGENELAPFVEQGTILGLAPEDNMPMYIESYTVGNKNLMSLMASGSVANSENLISNLSRNDIRLASYGHNMGKAAMNVTLPRVQTKGLKNNSDGAFDVKVKIAFNKDNSLMAYELFGNTALYNEMYIALCINGKVQMSDVTVSILHSDYSKDKLLSSSRTVYSKGQSFYIIPLDLFSGKSEDRLLIEYSAKPPTSQTKYYPTVQLLPINIISSGSNYPLANPAIKFIYPSEVRKESPAMQILDKNTGIPLYHVPNTSGWTDALGEPAGISRSGSFENAPTPTNVGFQYFCTTKAGKSFNKPIYWTGNGWVDAAGQIIK